MARVLFIEPFYSGSHRAFADGLRAQSRHEIKLLTLPGDEWRRRMRRGAQELARAVQGMQGEFDAIIATDMLDLPVFLALTRRRFGETPVLYYLHENQFTYPRLRGTKLNSWFGQINYLSAVAADRVAFNSEFHRADFLGALRTLAGTPNNWLVPEALEGIAAKASVLAIGLDLARFDAMREPKGDGPPMVLWNHRWEFDKAPDLFARVIRELAGEGLAFQVVIAGEAGDNPSPALTDLRDEVGERVAHFGYVESFEEYARLLWRSHVAVSTSRQEFFGVATVEAMYCECLPIVPSRLNYPALVPEALHGECLWESEVELRELLRKAIAQRTTARGAGRESAARFDWGQVAPQWDGAIEELVADSRFRA